MTKSQICAKGDRKVINKINFPNFSDSPPFPFIHALSTFTSLACRWPAAAPHLHVSEGWSPERKRGDGGRQELEEEGLAGWRVGADGCDETLSRRSELHVPRSFVSSPPPPPQTLLQHTLIAWFELRGPTHTFEKVSRGFCHTHPHSPLTALEKHPTHTHKHSLRV